MYYFFLIKIKHGFSPLGKRDVNSDQIDLDKRMLGPDKPSMQEIANKKYIETRDARLRGEKGTDFGFTGKKH